MQVIILWSEMPLLHFLLSWTISYLKVIVQDPTLLLQSPGSWDLPTEPFLEYPEWGPFTYLWIGLSREICDNKAIGKQFSAREKKIRRYIKMEKIDAYRDLGPCCSNWHHSLFPRIIAVSLLSLSFYRPHLDTTSEVQKPAHTRSW